MHDEDERSEPDEDDPPEVSVPVWTDITVDFGDSGDPPDVSVPVPTIELPSMGVGHFVLELRVPKASMPAFDASRDGHVPVTIRIVPE